ncbi:hypothetical protein Esti_004149 [Eimeria stiedai]
MVLGWGCCRALYFKGNDHDQQQQQQQPHSSSKPHRNTTLAPATRCPRGLECLGDLLYGLSAPRASHTLLLLLPQLHQQQLHQQQLLLEMLQQREAPSAAPLRQQAQQFLRPATATCACRDLGVVVRSGGPPGGPPSLQGGLHPWALPVPFQCPQRYTQQQRGALAGEACCCCSRPAAVPELTAAPCCCFSEAEVDCSVDCMQQQQQHTREMLLRYCCSDAAEPYASLPLHFLCSSSSRVAPYDSRFRAFSSAVRGSSQHSGFTGRAAAGGAAAAGTAAAALAAAAGVLAASACGKHEERGPLGPLLSLCGRLFRVGRSWGGRPLRSLDLPEALQHSHLQQPMDWGPFSRRFATALNSTVYTANTDDTCAPLWEPQALWPPVEDHHQQLQLQQQQQQHGFGAMRQTRAPSDSAQPHFLLAEGEEALQRSAAVGAPSVGGPPPLFGDSSQGGPQTLPGSRRVTCVQFAAADEALLALGFESGALEIWATQQTAEGGGGTPDEGPSPTAACRKATAAAAETPGSSPCGTQQRSTLLSALNALQQQLQQQQQQRCSKCCSKGPPFGGPEVTALAWHPRELLLAAAHGDGRVELWEVQRHRRGGHSRAGAAAARPATAAAEDEVVVRMQHVHSFVFGVPPSGPSVAIRAALGAPPTAEDFLPTAAAKPVMLQGVSSLAWGPYGDCLCAGGSEGGLLLFSLRALKEYQAAVGRLPGWAPLPAAPQQGEALTSEGPPSPSMRRLGAGLEVELEEGAPSTAKVGRLRGPPCLTSISSASTQPPSVSPPDTPLGRDAVLGAPIKQQPAAAAGETPCGAGLKAPLSANHLLEMEAFGRRFEEAPLGAPSRVFEGPSSTELRQLLLESYMPHFGGTQLTLHAGQGAPLGAPVVAGSWLLGVRSVLARAHGGVVRCLSFCMHDSRLLLSAGDTAAAAAGGPPAESLLCGSSRLKLWTTEEATLQPKTLLDIRLEGLVRPAVLSCLLSWSLLPVSLCVIAVTSMLWSRLTGELLLAHSWRRPPGGPLGAQKRGPRAHAACSRRGPGNNGLGGITVWRYLPDGGRSLLDMQQQQQEGLGAGLLLEDTSLLLQPLLVKVGGFGEPPVSREGGSSGSSNAGISTAPAAAATAAAGSAAAAAAAAEDLGDPLLLEAQTEVQQQRSRPNFFSLPAAAAVSSFCPWEAFGGPFGLLQFGGGPLTGRLRGGGLLSAGGAGGPLVWGGGGRAPVRSTRPRQAPPSGPLYLGTHSEETRATDSSSNSNSSSCCCCYAAADNASSLIQSGDGRVVAYWSLPSEVIAVWAVPPPLHLSPPWGSSVPFAGAAAASGAACGAASWEACWGSLDISMWMGGP